MNESEDRSPKSEVGNELSPRLESDYVAGLLSPEETVAVDAVLDDAPEYRAHLQALRARVEEATAPERVAQLAERLRCQREALNPARRKTPGKPFKTLPPPPASDSSEPAAPEPALPVKNEARRDWPPSWGWWAMAAALAVFIGIAAIWLHLGDRDAGRPPVASNPDASRPPVASNPEPDRLPVASNPEPDHPPVALNRELPGTFDLNSARALLNKPTIVESGMQLMGPDSPEIKRTYDGHTASVTYYDRSTRKLPLIVLPIIFQNGNAELANGVSAANVSLLADFLISLNPAEAKVAIEVHPRKTTAATADEVLSMKRARALQTLLQAKGVHGAIFVPIRGFGADAVPIPASLSAEHPANTAADADILLIRNE